VTRDRWKSEIRGDERANPQQSGNAVAGHPWLASRERGYWSRVLLRYWSWILAITAVVIAAAAGVAEVQTPIYTSQATVAVYPASATSSGLQPFVMGTEKGIASSGTVLSIASQSLLIPVSKLQHGLSITVPVDSDLLLISFSDQNPQVAQSLAEGIAQAYVAYRTSINQPTSARNAPSTPSTAGAVQAAVITDATLPTSPVSPDRLLIVGVAVILGLALGLGVVLIRDWMDDGLRGPLDLQTQANTPVLGQIPDINRMRRGVAHGLVMVNSPNSPVADAYLNLRTRVLQAAASRRSNTLLVTSPGSEDKTTIGANLAAALAMSGRKVVLVCADPRWGNADALFGLDGGLGLTSLVQGDANLADALRGTEVPGLQLLPSGPASVDTASVSQSTAFQKLLRELQSEADFVVIDAPPVLASADTAALAELGAMILLVADARASTRAGVRAASNELGHVRDCLIGCVLDRAGQAWRLHEPSKPAGMPHKEAAGTSSRQGSRQALNQNILNEPADSDHSIAELSNGNASPELGRQDVGRAGRLRARSKSRQEAAELMSGQGFRQASDQNVIDGVAEDQNVIDEAADSDRNLTTMPARNGAPESGDKRKTHRYMGRNEL
jgi:succinoglycan biosynthesis transport protein ExoP